MENNRKGVGKKEGVAGMGESKEGILGEGWGIEDEGKRRAY